VATDVQVAFGKAHRELARLAGERPSVTVLGSHGDRAFFGSTPQHLLRAGLGPVLLVRHPDPAMTAMPLDARSSPPPYLPWPGM
jgi:hypothetical protein